MYKWWVWLPFAVVGMAVIHFFGGTIEKYYQEYSQRYPLIVGVLSLIGLLLYVICEYFQHDQESKR